MPKSTIKWRTIKSVNGDQVRILMENGWTIGVAIRFHDYDEWEWMTGYAKGTARTIGIAHVRVLENQKPENAR